MKRAFFYLAMIAISMGAVAQIETPQPSPMQTLTQTVGMTDVTVEYSRPSVKGRTVFGDLVPYGKMWRTGANANTKITFSDAVMIGDTEVKAGEYAVFAKPTANNWEVYFYNDTTNWGTPAKWDDAKVVATVSVPVNTTSNKTESFTISFDELKMDGATMSIMWDNTHVGIPLKVMTDKAVSASIDRVMNGPAANDFYSAAVYYLESGKDISKAKDWIDKAVSLRPDAFWYQRQQSLIYAKAGDKKGAIKAAKSSMELAKKAGNDDYVALNMKSLKEWGGL